MTNSKAMRNLVLVSSLALAVAGCETREEILPGLREGLRSPAYDITNPNAVAQAEASAAEAALPFQNASVPVNLGPASDPASWTHAGSNAQHRLPNATLAAAPQLVWSSKGGAGNDRKYRITAEPVAADGQVFTMDSHANVVAHAISGAGALWSADLTAPGERAGSGTGGGLALGDGKLFATTSFGELLALDPANGTVLWRQKFNGAIHGAPTVVNGKVYVATAASQAFAVDTDTGRIAWTLSGVPSQHGLSGLGTPTVSGNLVLFPLDNGSLIGTDVASGDPRWVARLAGDRPGSAHSILQAFSAAPVVEGSVVYTASPAGRAMAVRIDNGGVLWTADEGAQGAMAVAGGAVFFVSDEGKLVRLSARDGSKIWSVDLPRYEQADKPRKLKSIWPAFGPVMASGRLWIASGDGILRSFDPADGSLLGAVALPAGAASRPITVSGLMMLMSETGDLVALR